MRKAGRALIVVLLLGALATQAMVAVRETSATDDEPYCIVSGLSALLTNDYRLNLDHPPLMNMICGAAAYLAGAAPLPLNEDWARGFRLKYSYRYLWEGPNGPNAVRLIAAARLPVVALSLAVALLVFLWARRLYGWPAALLPLALYCFDPNLIAHSSVATLDLGLTAAFFFAIYACWRYLRTRRRLYFILTGLALGAAMAVKLPGVLLLAVLPILMMYGNSARSGAEGDSEEPFSVQGAARTFGAVLGIALIALWAVYRFGLGPVSTGPGAVRIPLGQYWQSIAFQLGHESSGHVAYLLGKTSSTGWWYYYPLTFLVKTPLPLLILLGLAFGLGKPDRDEFFLIVPAAIFFGFTTVQRLDLGVRYILPVYPLLIVFTGRLLGRRVSPPEGRPWLARWPLALKSAVVALALWAVAEALMYSPNYIAYFNQLAGGPARGGRILADSNLDWGQDLRRLAAWQRAHPEASPLYFAYFGPADVARYGVRCEHLPDLGPRQVDKPAEWYVSGSRPRSGWIAISVNCLKLMTSYRWLESYEPVDRAGYSILIYHIPELSGEVSGTRR